MSGLALHCLLPRVIEPELEHKKYANLLVSLLERRERAEVLCSFPCTSIVDPSTVCSLQCPHCSVGNRTIMRTKAVFDPELARLSMSELADMQFIVWFFNTGEPLLNPHLPELLGIFRKHQIFSIVSTNLSLPLTDTTIDALLNSGLGILSVSIDGATEDAYAMYRVGGDFHVVMANLERIIRRKRALGLCYPLIEWRFLVFEHNRSQMHEAKRIAEAMEVDLIEFFPRQRAAARQRSLRGARPGAPRACLRPSMETGAKPA